MTSISQNVCIDKLPEIVKKYNNTIHAKPDKGWWQHMNIKA